MFDKGIESDELHDIIDKYLWSQPEVVSVTFGRVEKFIPLQAADMIATESYWHTRSSAARLPFQHYLRHAKAAGLIFDRQAIIDELARRDANGVPKRLSRV
jgi:hypothetical protein